MTSPAVARGGSRSIARRRSNRPRHWRAPSAIRWRKMIKINMGLPPEVARAPDAAAMKTLPGLPTMAALMLSALITVWLGLWGPIDIQKLKDWQPLMASIIAPTIVLGAA